VIGLFYFILRTLIYDEGYTESTTPVISSSSPSLYSTITPLRKNTNIRYVRIEGRYPILNLAEVVVNDVDDVNVALNKNVFQSSLEYGGDPSFAVDGKTDGSWLSGVTNTKAEDSPWWEVDLSGSFTIKNIIIFNRTDKFSDRLTNAKIMLLNPDRDIANTLTYSSANDVAPLSRQFDFKVDDMYTTPPNNTSEPTQIPLPTTIPTTTPVDITPLFPITPIPTTPIPTTSPVSTTVSETDNLVNSLGYPINNLNISTVNSWTKEFGSKALNQYEYVSN
jgi:hypothetical protein